HHPLVTEFLRGAIAAVVEAGDRGLDRIAHLALGGAVDAVALLPRRVDGGLKLFAHCPLKIDRRTLYAGSDGVQASRIGAGRGPYARAGGPPDRACRQPRLLAVRHRLARARGPRPRDDGAAGAAGGDRPFRRHADRLAAREPLRDLAAMAGPLCAR